MEISDQITSVGSKAFKGCSELISVKLSKNITSFDSEAFMRCEFLTNVLMPETINYVGSSAFMDCSSLTDLHFIKDKGHEESSNSSTDCEMIINTSAFKNCFRLCSVTLSPYLTVIAGEAFAMTFDLKELKIPEGVKCLGVDSFTLSGLKSVALPKSLVDLDRNAFMSCMSLETISIQENVSFISSGTFLGCLNLKSITLSPQIKSIGYDTFQCSNNLNRIINIGNLNKRVFYQKTLIEFSIERKNHMILNSLKDYENQILYSSFPDEDRKKIFCALQVQRSENDLIDQKEVLKYCLQDKEVFRSLVKSDDKSLMSYVLFRIQDIKFFEKLINCYGAENSMFEKYFLKFKALSDMKYPNLRLKFQKSQRKEIKTITSSSLQNIVDFIPIQEQTKILILTKNSSPEQQASTLKR